MTVQHTEFPSTVQTPPYDGSRLTRSPRTAINTHNWRVVNCDWA